MNPHWSLGAVFVIASLALWVGAGIRRTKELRGPLFLLAVAAVLGAQVAAWRGAGWALPTAGWLALLGYVLFLGSDEQEESGPLAQENHRDQAASAPMLEDRGV